MKKKVVFFIILVFFLYLLAACSGIETSGVEAAETGTAEGAAAGSSNTGDEKKPDVNGSEKAAEAGPEIPDGISVSGFDEFKEAAADTSTKVIIISGSVDISEEGFVFEPESETSVYIPAGATFTVSAKADLNNCAIYNYGIFAVTDTGDLLMIGNEEGTTTFINNGTAETAGKFIIPYIDLANYGSISIKGTGLMAAARMAYQNCGKFTLEDGGNLDLSKGCAFDNSQGGTLTNGGYILVDEGGSINNNGGSIDNNGVIDIYSYFMGEIESITGSGKVNDYREE